MKSESLHIYFHYPFCIKKCDYCDFVSTEYNKELSDFYLKSLIKELEIIKRDSSFLRFNISTIYFGGGSPDLIKGTLLTEIIENIHINFNVIENPEITLEVNPDHVKTKKIKAIREAGINRISLGVQSFSDRILRILGRKHTSVNAEDAISIIRDTGFENLSIDLIYGIPTQNFNEFKNDVHKAAGLKPEHISMYLLDLSEDVPLFKKIKRGDYPTIDENEVNNMYDHAVKVFSNNGLYRYEISNFAKENRQSRHNSAYWNFKPYLGIGLGAHSYFNNERHWNTKNFSKYSELINKNILPMEGKEILSERDQFNEKIMLGLRQEKGLDISELKIRFSKHLFDDFLSKLNELVIFPETKNCFIFKNNILFLKSFGILISDSLIGKLIV